MYLQSAKDQVSIVDGKLTLTMPFPIDGDFVWPFIHPSTDSGKYIVGLFEGRADANGIAVHAVSAWTSPKELLAAMSRECGREVAFRTVSADEFQRLLPEAVAEDLTQTMLLVGGYGYYGPGEETNQAHHDKW